MDMSNFSDSLKRVLAVSEEIANKYKTAYIGSEHILLGMLCVDGCTGGSLLSEAGVNAKEYEIIFKRTIDRNSKIHGYTPRTKSIFERAIEFSMVDNAFKALAGTEHMLLAVLNMEECLAVKILQMLGVNLDALVSKTEAHIGPAEEDERPAPAAYSQSEQIGRASCRERGCRYV